MCLAYRLKTSPLPKIKNFGNMNTSPTSLYNVSTSMLNSRCRHCNAHPITEVRESALQMSHPRTDSDGLELGGGRSERPKRPHRKIWNQPITYLRGITGLNPKNNFGNISHLCNSATAGRKNLKCVHEEIMIRLLVWAYNLCFVAFIQKWRIRLYEFSLKKHPVTLTTCLQWAFSLEK
jgi:hypothetical protein